MTDDPEHEHDVSLVPTEVLILELMKRHVHFGMVAMRAPSADFPLGTYQRRYNGHVHVVAGLLADLQATMFNKLHSQETVVDPDDT